MKICFVLLLLFVTGCATEPKVETGPAASVSGYAYLYSNSGNILSTSAGITVTDVSSGRSAVTNDSGKWTITGLPFGTHSFAFTKQGFGSMKLFDFKTEGKDTLCGEEVDMCQPVTDIINFQRFSISISALDSIASYNIIGAMQPPFLETRSVVLCISSDSAKLAKDPSSAPIVLSFVTQGSGYDGNFDWGSTGSFSVGGKSFVHGTIIYATVCVSGMGPAAEYLGNYFDPTTGRQVFTDIKEHSQILSTIMP